MKGMNFLLP